MLARRIVVPVSVILLAAACGAPSQSDGPLGSSTQPIVYGTADTANPHTAVVALLNPDSGGYDQCSGTIVQVKAGVASVLTAAHCCNQTQPTVVVMSSDYSVGVPYVSGSMSTPAAPAYAVIASSVKYDTAYNGNASAPVDDFCMLQFNAPATATSIPVATGSDGLAVGSLVDYVGFGVTTDATNNSNTIRNIASNVSINTAVGANTFSYTEGMATPNRGGPCEGDSGGPALVPPGVPQSQQKVVGTTSYGSAKCQPAGSTGVDMRVISQTGMGGFIASYLGLTGSGDAGSTSGGDAGTGTGTVPTTCAEADGNPGCCIGNTIYFCATGATPTLTTQTCTGTKVCGWKTTSTGSYYGCVAPPASGDPSNTYPLTCGAVTTTTPDAGSGDASTSTDGGTSSADGSTSTGDGGSSTSADGSAVADGSTAVQDGGTGLPDATVTGTPDSGVVIVGSADSGTVVLGAPDGAATGTTAGDGGDGSSGNTGGCSTSGTNAGTPPWFAIGLALAGLGSRRRKAVTV
jgi:uncharacterized protein (TIGR03382 family)